MRRLILIVAASLAACGSDRSTGPRAATVAGVYDLRTVGGQPLPWVVQPDPDDYFAVDAMQLKLSPGGNAWNVIHYRTEFDRSSVQVDSAYFTWLVRGRYVVISADGQAFDSSVVSGDALDLHAGEEDDLSLLLHFVRHKP